jgi:regulator of sigma E protease
MPLVDMLSSSALLADWPGWIVWLANWENLLVVLKVALGLGFIIFVHELGHFAVAKWCGVKCEKFYVGFDVPIKLGFGKWGIRLPSALWKRKWGETEYGIGILPLGGYVKMLGQDDNPARAAEAVREARMKAEVAKEAAAAGTVPQANAMVSEGGAVATATADEVEYVLDPRSYMAKSVPQRMAIISAGVVMNVIFAVVFATIAYGLGVPYDPPVVGNTVPGQGAWRADFQVGDRIVEIEDEPIDKFIKLRSEVTSLAEEDVADGLKVLIERDGKEITLNVRPEATRSIIMLGINGPMTTKLLSTEPTRKHTPAAKQDFKPGDQVIRINGREIANAHQLTAALAEYQDEEIDVAVRREIPLTDGSASAPKVEEHSYKVGTRLRKWVGAWMKFGTITAVKDHSPAAKAGVQEGDKIVSINGAAADTVDPVTWPSDVRRFAKDKPGEKIKLVVERDKENVSLELTPIVPSTYDQPGGLDLNWLTSNLALGIAYEVQPIVAGVSRNSAADGKLQPGDEVQKALFVPANEEQTKEEIKLSMEYGIGKRPVDFSDKTYKPTWSWLADRMLFSLSETNLKLTIRRGDKTEDVTLPIVEQPGYFHVNRGFQFEGWEEIEKAGSAADAFSLGLRETGFALTAVVRFLRKIYYDPKAGENLGSVLTIGGAAGSAAKQGWSELLIFMTLISANLAVINFLPIPVLDGGHMVFLAYEGIRGKPADERVFGILTMIGFVLLLSLMVFVFWLDIQRFFLR